MWSAPIVKPRSATTVDAEVNPFHLESGSARRSLKARVGSARNQKAAESWSRAQV
jgi:hypothetical protein